MSQRRTPRVSWWLATGRVLAIAVTLVAATGWTARAAQAAPAFALPLFTNEGVAVSDNISSYANFDGGGHDYSGTALAAAGFRSGSIVSTHGASFQWPQITEGAPDNWTAPTASPITIPITAPSGSAVAFLGSSITGPSSGVASLTFSDNSTLTFTLTLSDWTLNGGGASPSAGNSIAATTSYQDLTTGFTRSVASYVFFVAPVTVPAGETLVGVTLPATVTKGVLHIFSVAAIVPTPAFNNEGISPTDGVTTTADFDGAGDSYSSAALRAAGLALAATGAPDNWSQAGQILPIPAVSSGLLGFLGAAVNGPSSGVATITYTDGSTQTFTLTFSDWTLNGGSASPAGGNSIAATTPYRDTAGGGRVVGSTYVFLALVQLQAGKTPLSAQLPVTISAGAMHVFAMHVFAVGAVPIQRT